MRLLERAYRSRFGRVMSIIGHAVARIQKPFMVYGYTDPETGEFRKYTRMSSTTTIMNQSSLSLGDHVWAWHYSILDATEGLTIEEGCQIGAWVGIFTHGSERAIRLLGRDFVHVHNTQREGYTRGSVRIGAYSFVGAGSVILPDITIGRGCLIGTGTLVTKDVPDYSVVVGSPGKIRGSTLELDRELIEQNEGLAKSYYDPDALARMR